MEEENNSLRILKNIQTTPLKLDVVLLQQEISIKQLMTLSPGSVLPFDYSVKTPAYLTVNRKKIAKGTVVQANEHYGLRVDEILA
ncbi:MAG: Type flagellar switch regulator (C-ring) FliN C-term [Chlamydiales bacterium]|jgi:flagellar motor switch protein FliN/FliY|nr:Type flagellar switch regulator (C-ring) FliN C-term [Chlamydiales bacterium]